MNILIPNSWLREFLKTDAKPFDFAKVMSLTSVSIERTEKVDDDLVFDIEVTTNRPDLMSVKGLAREAAAILPQAGFKAEFIDKKIHKDIKKVTDDPILKITSDPTLVNRILAVVMEVDLKPSPKVISQRLERSGIRSINNVVDVTNYIMRQVGHPSHVFDYDRLTNHTLNIRRSKKGERITTLDGIDYELPGNDIVADNGEGEIVDLLGIMGTANSVVVDTTKRIVLFLDNNNPTLLRNTSMNIGIRTEAAILNEKGVDPEIMMPTMLTGIKLLEEIASGKVISPIIDIYPNKPKTKNIKLKTSKINDLIGVEIKESTIVSILEDLGFGVTKIGDQLSITVPTIRIDDVDIPEDIVEEVARVYGYHKIPNKLPDNNTQTFYHQDTSEYYWIKKLKDAFKFWGFNEVYTYSMVSEALFEGPVEDSVKIKNPLSSDRQYLRRTLSPSLMDVADFNKSQKEINIFEISNVYLKNEKGLPDEKLHLAALSNDKNLTFYNFKGVVEQVMKLLGVEKVKFKVKEDSINGADVIVNGKSVGFVEEADETILEIDLSYLLEIANNKKVYNPPPKFPPVIEDVRVEFEKHFPFDKISKTITEVSDLVESVSILDEYKNRKTTYRIIFQSKSKNLTNEDITPIREEIYKRLQENFKAKIG